MGAREKSGQGGWAECGRESVSVRAASKSEGTRAGLTHIVGKSALGGVSALPLATLHQSEAGSECQGKAAEAASRESWAREGWWGHGSALTGEHCAP
jgi:hypothetical protein